LIVTLRLPERRTIITGLLIVALVVGTVLTIKYFRSSDDGGSSSVPTVPVAGTPTNIGCIDEAGTTTAPLDEWYPDDADGAVSMAGEISASLRLGDFSAAATDAVVANAGRLATSAVRDLSPTPTACVTIRYGGYALEDGSEVDVIAWRVISATSPNTVPNEAGFTEFDDTTLVSMGPHLASTLSVAPDGSTVLVSSYGVGARSIVGDTPTVGTEPVAGTEPGLAPLTAEQLAAIGAAVLQQVVTR
jgi:hypothetical protein